MARGWCQSSVIGFVVVLLLLVNGGLHGVRGELSDRDLDPDRKSCFETVSSWSAEQLDQLSSLPSKSTLDRLKLRDLLFFLHVPRTGGRNFDQCFLRHIYSSKERCAWSYDQIRFNRSHPECRLVTTHDDYSLLDELPLDKTSVVTNVRNPVDRVLSAYEFTIRVAARVLQVPKISQHNSSSGPVNKKHSKDNTLNIWPWRYLVTMMEQDLLARREARGAVDVTATGLSVNNSYDAPAIAMPFEEFINHPAAHELVHNGATFQVAGVANISFSTNAGAIRDCVIRFPPLGKFVVDVAKKRLDRMMYVGLTDRQNESTLFFARALASQISMEQVLKTFPPRKVKSKTGIPTMEPSRMQANVTSLDEFTEEQVAEVLLESYKTCSVVVRKSHDGRRTEESMKPIEFSRERRKLIPDDVMEKVSAFNLLDTELYEHAQVLFQKQQEFLQHGDFHFVKGTEMSSGNIDNTTEGLKEMYMFLDSREDLPALWGFTSVWVLIMLMVLMAVLYEGTKRRDERVKMF